MKIGIFTFHCAQNYGAVLQAYALQEFLCSIGYDAYIVDYRPDYLLKEYSLFPTLLKKEIKLFYRLFLFMRDLYFLPIRLMRRIRFNSFVARYLRIQSLDLSNKNNDYDVFIFGGDQIWNPKITKDIDRVYLGDFPAAEGRVLISYAASVGSVSNYNDEQTEYLISRLNKFHLVGVRERDLATFLSTRGINAQLVCDPVFLPEKIIFEQMAKKFSKKSSPFLLFFQLSKTKVSYEDFVREQASQLQLEFIDVISHRETIRLPFSKQCISPEKFLSYIYNSDIMVTTSFHGAAISIVFNKRVYAIRTGTVMDQRVENLFELMELKECMISTDSNIPIEKSHCVDLECCELIKNSKDYIRQIKSLCF